jgi:hypothetical protein
MLREINSSISEDAACGAPVLGKEEPIAVPKAVTASPFNASRRVIAIHSPVIEELSPPSLSL